MRKTGRQDRARAPARAPDIVQLFPFMAGQSWYREYWFESGPGLPGRALGWWRRVRDILGSIRRCRIPVRLADAEKSAALGCAGRDLQHARSAGKI